MSGGLRIGSLAGIPVYLHYTWFAIFALVTVNLTIVFGSEGFHPEWSLVQRSALAAVTAVLFFASVVAHELSHSLVALRNRIPVESITLFIFGGLARISKEADSAKIEGLVAVAGPAMSIGLAIVFFLISLTIGGSVEAVGIVTAWLAYINLALGLFNLIPGFPMDGGRVLRAILWARSGDFTQSTRRASIVGRVFGFLFMVAGGAEILLMGNLGGLWLVLIGWFIENAASSSYQQVQLQEALARFVARDIMAQNVPSIEPNSTVDEVVHGSFIPLGVRCLIVRDGHQPVGLISATDVREIDREAWTSTTVASIMTPWEKVIVAQPDTPAPDVLALMVDHNINQVPVTYNDAVVGLVTRERLLQAVRMQSELRR